VITRRAVRLRVTGVVQGVGFRPFVATLAVAHDVDGWVRNEGGVVTIHAEADPAHLEAFEAALQSDPPRLACVERVERTRAEPVGERGFIVERSRETEGDRLVPPDAATCPACLAELLDPSDRRYRYAFINCTDCGPRFTVIDGLPYDRERTSMRGFEMCDACRQEYEDPQDRRFHAEPIACPACGPRLRFVGPGEGRDPVVSAAAVLSGGGIVALKGLGGFHLACDATNERAVALLRERKHRPDKPFAVMVSDVEASFPWFDPTPAEIGALTSWRAPIVLVADRGELAPPVAPGHRRHGAMLPATPLHHLLTREVGVPLVMTSGNAADEPICIDDAEALDRLGTIADAFILHDRPIVARYDDSVTTVRTGSFTPTVVRRARAFAPHPIALATPVGTVTLGTGAELHGAFCIAVGSRAYLSQHIGDLDTDEALAAYRIAYDRCRALFDLDPVVAGHDLHPDYLTTRFAESLGIPRVGVQHHHAHVVATMAEHGLTGDVLGIAFDGMGYGEDDTIWGGEFLVCSARDARRVGRLRPVPQPGGDAATRHPWRMAAAHARDAGVLDEATPWIGAPDPTALDVAMAQAAGGLATPLTSSAGRLFDAVAALTGVCRNTTYDGQAAMLLEQAARPGGEPWPVAPAERDGLLEIDTRDLIAPVVERLAAGDPIEDVAGRFHATLAAAAAAAAVRLAEVHGLHRVVIGGGVFANDLLTTDVCARLTAAGLQVFLPREVPVGDGGIALGQAVVAAAREVT
jgi:hydrogenase maturation protein HypF